MPSSVVFENKTGAVPSRQGLTRSQHNSIVVSMIPAFDGDTGNLPHGIHEAGWGEFVARYGYTPYRLVLLASIKDALDQLRDAGCRRVYINGSFVTSTRYPRDFDACWEAAGVDADRLDPDLLDNVGARVAQKEKYGGELFAAHSPADLFGTRFIDFFQHDRDTGEPKGIIRIDLGGLP